MIGYAVVNDYKVRGQNERILIEDFHRGSVVRVYALRVSNQRVINRIKLQDIEIGLAPARSTLERDEQIKDDALRYNAILITGDNAMKAFAQSKSLFCFYV